MKGVLMKLNKGEVILFQGDSIKDAGRELVKAIAADMADVYVPFQALFDDLTKVAPASCWAEDGVHPTPGGHQKMAEFWIKRVLSA
jgi:lysophospholipase L1-like esterase